MNLSFEFKKLFGRGHLSTAVFREFDLRRGYAHHHAQCRAALTRRLPVDWVDPMLGTNSSRWMLYPGPSLPFGMVKLSPDNEDFPKRWYKGGHEYSIENIAGFITTIKMYQMSAGI